MTVRKRHLGRAVVGLVVFCFVAGGLSVEAITHDGVSRARRALPSALARAVASDDLDEADLPPRFRRPQGVRGEDARGPTDPSILSPRARRLAREVPFASRFAARNPAAVARTLEAILAETPTADLEHAASLACMAAGDGKAAARHAQLAVRLAPDDARIAAAAEDALDLAVAWRLRPFTRPMAVVGAGVLLVLLVGAFGRHRDRRRLRIFLEGVRARVHAWADGEQLTHPLVIGPRTEKLTLDVFLSGRYGMACPRRPDRAPTLHMAFSSAGSNQTIRLRPIPRVTDSAIRVPVSGETLKRLHERPGRWRLHLRLGGRPILAVPLEVRAAARPPSGHGQRVAQQAFGGGGTGRGERQRTGSI